MAKIARRRLVSLAALTAMTAVTMTMTACGSHNDAGAGAGLPAAVAGNDDDSGDGGFGPTVTVTFDVSGETELKGTSTSSTPTDNAISPQSCTEYAKGALAENGKTHYNLPTFLNDKISGKKILIGAMVEDYKGPATYDLDTMAGQGTPPGIEVDNRPYVAQPDTSTGNVEIDANGGGTFTFTRLAFSDGNGQVSPGITGKVSWTCKD